MRIKKIFLGHDELKCLYISILFKFQAYMPSWIEIFFCNLCNTVAL